ncbi:hypothetical protein L1O03_00155 [Corynebacterium uropygiale]|uniref:DUF2568 domain-containing protein n=1 Tax=Corynebacterium uropygiale TaxID=1775911 RepID=A0A9X1TZD1_9CORY|nr:hypothetical protein [Corynebacterium uropygiale]MCF4005599.1 hypothetical protein [Corynebacterium uropygiale]
MELKTKIRAFAVMCGFALAASVEAGEHFDVAHPWIFYGIHGVFVVLAVTWMLKARSRGRLSTTLVIRGCVALALLYAVAATRAAIAPAAIAVVGIATIALWVWAENNSRRSSAA